MNESCVVVGVDGSPGSRAALEYAMAEAARRRALLRVVAAVTLPEFWDNSYGMYVPPPPGDTVEDVRKEVERFVEGVVAAGQVPPAPYRSVSRPGLAVRETFCWMPPRGPPCSCSDIEVGVRCPACWSVQSGCTACCTPAAR